jgi:hypothetical protein
MMFYHKEGVDESFQYDFLSDYAQAESGADGCDEAQDHVQKPLSGEVGSGGGDVAVLREVVGIDIGGGGGEVWPEDDGDHQSDNSQDHCEVSLALFFWVLKVLLAAEPLYGHCEEVPKEEDGHSSAGCDGLDA